MKRRKNITQTDFTTVLAASFRIFPHLASSLLLPILLLFFYYLGLLFLHLFLVSLFPSDLLSCLLKSGRRCLPLAALAALLFVWPTPELRKPTPATCLKLSEATGEILRDPCRCRDWLPCWPVQQPALIPYCLLEKFVVQNIKSHASTCPSLQSVIPSTEARGWQFNHPFRESRAISFERGQPHPAWLCDA